LKTQAKEIYDRETSKGDVAMIYINHITQKVNNAKSDELLLLLAEKVRSEVSPGSLRIVKFDRLWCS